MKAGYSLDGRGGDLAITVRGPDAAACLAAVVEAFGAFVANVDADVERHRVPVEVHGADPAELLLELVDDAILRLDSDGELAVGLGDATLGTGDCTGTLEVVRLGDVHVHGDAPKAATWHDLRLEETDDGWEGHVLLDL